MRRTKVAFGLVTMLVFGLAATATAFAAPFFSSTAIEKLLSEKVEMQIFNTEAMTIECTKATITAGQSSLETTEQAVTVKYEGCTAFGFLEVTVSPAEYIFFANENVAIVKNITIVTAGCEVVIKKELVTKATYVTKGANIHLTPAVKIKAVAAGAVCTKVGPVNGEYKGNLEFMIPLGKMAFTP